MREVPITRARREIKKMVRLVSHGSSIAITRHGVPVAVVEPYSTMEFMDRQAPFYAAFGTEILEHGMGVFNRVRDQAMTILSPEPLGAVARDKLIAKMKELYTDGTLNEYQ
jgi:prevent-host-death family protein